MSLSQCDHPDCKTWRSHPCGEGCYWSPAKIAAPKDVIKGFAVWHPEHGLHVPHMYEGPLAYACMDDAASDICDLNRDAGQNTRRGWRIVPVTITREEQE